jgi:hypothetical protein
MALKTPRRLVIDADVLRSAGEENAQHPRSMICRDFLIAVRSICHHAALSTDLEREWEKHSSRFSRKWYASMESRKKIQHLPDDSQHDFTEMLQDEGLTLKQRRAVMKDLHLVEAAMFTDSIVVSLDKEAVELMQQVLCCDAPFRKLCWINPESDPVQVHEWLQNGAKAEKRWRLCADD